MAFSTYDMAHDGAGTTAQNAALNTDFALVEQRLAALELLTGVTEKVTPTLAKVAYTEGTFTYNSADHHFTIGAFVHPVYGSLNTNLLAANVGGNYPGTSTPVNTILADMITRGITYLVVGPEPA